MEKSVGKFLRERGAAVVPGVYDALSAKIAARAGFGATFVTGYGASASHLGMPDMGFLNQSDLCDVARRICDAVQIPVIADADTGYGNELNVRQTVRRLMGAGARGCFLEDQQWPKRCGHMRGKRIVPRDEYAGKIRAAAEERGDADFFIVARTDAIATSGLDEALARMGDAKAAGADGFFVEAPENRGQMLRVCAEAPRPLVANMIEGGRTPLLSREELGEMGYALILYPLTATYAAARAVSEALSALHEKEVGGPEGLMAFAEFNQLVEAEKFMRLTGESPPE